MSDFKELKVWQKAHALALAVDRTANSSRSGRHASLRSQMIRAAMSIDANIAEGRGHNSDKELNRFLKVSIASAYELESHLIMGRDLHFLKEADFVRLMEQLIEVRKMPFGLTKYLRTSATRACRLRHLTSVTRCFLSFNLPRIVHSSSTKIPEH